MVKITLTTFLDFTSASAGRPRLTQVKKAIDTYGKEYDPQRDFYRPFRDALMDLVEEGRDAASLDDVLVGLHAKKVDLYKKLVEGYRKWVMSRTTGRRTRSDHKATWTTSSAPDLEIKVNPELSVAVAGQEFLVKLYLKKEKPAQRTVDSALWIIKEALPTSYATPAVLDVQRGKLHAATLDPEVRALANSDAASFAAMWRDLSAPQAA